MMRKILYSLMLQALLFLVAGCACTESNIDKTFGFNTQEAFNQQVAYPDKKVSAIPPTGMDGIHSERLMTGFNTTYGRSIERDQEGMTSTVINISNAPK